MTETERAEQTDRVIGELERNRDRYLQEMIELVRIPSISPGLPQPQAMTEAAGWLEQRLRQAGIDEVRQLRRNGSSPVVWARRRQGDHLPTVLFYGHYDVMPPEPIEEWTSPPFDPQVRDGELFGRGTADDKGQLLMHINAVEAYLAVGNSLPVNVVFAIEGEEEEGSETLNRLLDSDPSLFAADVAVVSDSPLFARDCPSLCYGLRGIAVAEITVDGPASDLHSGNFGGAVANPAEMLTRILNDLKDRTGRVSIPGFYDDVLEPSEEERRAFGALPFAETELCRDAGVEQLYGEEGYSALERIWVRPTLEVNGIGGGFQEEGSKTIIPASAFAKVSMRLVPDQDPQRILDLFQQHVAAIAPPAVKVRVERGHTGEPFLAPLDTAEVQAARRALQLGFGDEVHLIRDGASIPIVAALRQKLGATCLLIGVDVPDGRIHAPNEKIVLDNFYRGTRTIAHLLRELAPPG